MLFPVLLVRLFLGVGFLCFCSRLSLFEFPEKMKLSQNLTKFCCSDILKFKRHQRSGLSLLFQPDDFPNALRKTEMLNRDLASRRPLKTVDRQ